MLDRLLKKRLPRILSKYARIAKAIGTPTTALGSVPVTTLAMSPNRLMARIVTASQYAHRAPRHRPTAADAQAALTMHIRTIAHTPILAKPSRARGLIRHIGSRKLPGKSSDTKAIKLMVAPNQKNILRAVIPTGRLSDLVIILIIPGRLTPELTGEREPNELSSEEMMK